MAITYTIPGVPLLNQLKEPSNPTYDCVFESNAALATAYLHQPYTGTQIKALDSNYGPNYTGGASEKNLVDTMASLGITVTAEASPTQQGLVDIIHREVPLGHGVIVTMPSQWNSAPVLAGAQWNPRTYAGPSHVGLACGVGPGMIRVMNPWGGFFQDNTDAWWAARLLAGEVWVGVPTMIDLTNADVARYFEAGAKTQYGTDWKCKSNGVVLAAGALQQFYQSYGASALCGLTFLGLPVANQVQITGLSAVAWYQRFERGTLVYDPKHVYDAPPGVTGTVYLAHVDTGAPQVDYAAPLTTPLQASVKALTSQVAALQAQEHALEQQLAAVPAPAPVQPPDPHATEALAALLELAKALKLLDTAA